MQASHERGNATEKATRKNRVIIDDEYCKGCGICVQACPQQILFQSNRLNSYGYRVVEAADSSLCRGCLRCAFVCPDVVFTIVQEDNGHASNDER